MIVLDPMVQACFTRNWDLLGSAALSFCCWPTRQPQMVGGIRPNPEVSQLFEQVAVVLRASTPSEAGSKERYHLTYHERSASGQRVISVVAQVYDLSTAILLDADRVNLGILVNLVVPDVLRTLQASQGFCAPPDAPVTDERRLTELRAMTPWTTPPRPGAAARPSAVSSGMGPSTGSAPTPAGRTGNVGDDRHSSEYGVGFDMMGSALEALDAANQRKPPRPRRSADGEEKGGWFRNLYSDFTGR